jgi:hypothetical protein
MNTLNNDSNTSNTLAPVLTFKDLLARVESPRDKFFVALVSAMVDEGTAERTAQILSAYEPVDTSRVMHGIKVSSVMGFGKEKAMENFGLTSNQVEEIFEYVGIQN